jgi:parvulin-like peptidyl-prolyl isomerase
MVQSQIDALATKLGSTTELANWEKQNGYNDQSFKKALTRSIAAAWERDQIISQVPTTADQVHARQILVNTLSEAQDILAKLKAGTDFATLAYYYNPTTGGDLGWFPKGYLTMPEVEDAAFSLKVGEYSDIIQSKIGYHIIQVIERDPNHPLSADARFVLQNQTLQKWIADRRSSSQIQIMLP